MPVLAQFLAKLTTRLAFGLFLAAFALGAGSIIFRIWVPWFPVAVVALYGYVLLRSARTYRVQHSETTNNSPYFLGFLFFLVSLARTFSGFSIEGGDTQINFIIGQLGAALFSTIVGIGFRHALFAFSPQIADQDLFFRTLEDELRRSATEFRKSQTELASLVTEFLELRKTLFADEEKASRKYVRNLEKAIALFDDQLAQYPITIGAALTGCKEVLSGLQIRLADFAEAAGYLDASKLTGAVEQLGTLQAATRTLVADIRQFTDSVVTVKSETDSLPAHIRTTLVELKNNSFGAADDFRQKLKFVQADIEQIDAVLSEFITLAREKIEALSE